MIERDTDIRNIKRQLRELSEARFREQTNAKDFAHRLHGVLASRPGSSVRPRGSTAEAGTEAKGGASRRWWPAMLVLVGVLAIVAGVAWAVLGPA